MQGLELMQKVLGLEHPGTLAGMSNLAQTLSQLGRHDEAEGVLQMVRNIRKVLELQKKVMGPEHLLTIRSMRNLAETLGQLGKHTEAKIMQQQVREISEVHLIGVGCSCQCSCQPCRVGAGVRYAGCSCQPCIAGAGAAAKSAGP
eukprot:1156520-Pelagomonas_calceolata.AAC.6